MVVLLNCAAVIFNLIPIPPLDGFGIIAPLLSPSLRAIIYSFSMFGLILVIVAFNTSPAFSDIFPQHRQQHAADPERRSLVGGSGAV